MTIAEIHQLCDTYAHRPDRPLGPHLARLLHAAKARIEERITALQRTHERIERCLAEQPTAPSGAPDANLFVDDPRTATPRDPSAL